MAKISLNIPPAFLLALSSRPGVFLSACAGLIEAIEPETLNAIGLDALTLSRVVASCTIDEADSATVFIQALACSPIGADEQCPIEAALRAFQDRYWPGQPLADFTTSFYLSESVAVSRGRLTWLGSPCSRFDIKQTWDSLGALTPDEIKACSLPGGFLDQCAASEELREIDPLEAIQNPVLIDLLLQAMERHLGSFEAGAILLSWIPALGSFDYPEISALFSERAIGMLTSCPDRGAELSGTLLLHVASANRSALLDSLAHAADKIKIELFLRHPSKSNTYPRDSLFCFLPCGRGTVDIPDTEASRLDLSRFTLADFALALAGRRDSEAPIAPEFDALAARLRALSLDSAPLARGTPQALGALIDLRFAETGGIDHALLESRCEAIFLQLDIAEPASKRKSLLRV